MRITISALWIFMLAGLLVFSAASTVSAKQVNTWFRNKVIVTGSQTGTTTSTSSTTTTVRYLILGGDRDKHGCIGSAGYTWCEPKRKCIRLWDDRCENDTGREYVSKSQEFCATNQIDCIPGMMSFGDDTGCGCQPAYRFIVNEDRECSTDSIICGSNMMPFKDFNGCGCEPTEPYRPKTVSTTTTITTMPNPPIQETAAEGFTNGIVDHLEIKAKKEGIKKILAIGTIAIHDTTAPQSSWIWLKSISADEYSKGYNGYKFKIDHIVYDEKFNAIGFMLDVKRPDGTTAITYLKLDN